MKNKAISKDLKTLHLHLQDGMYNHTSPKFITKAPC